MHIYDIIRKKRDGHELNKNEIKYLIDGYSNNSIPDYQISAFLMAVYFNKMTVEERSLFTKAMLESGNSLNFKSIKGIKVDKHSTGGVGDGTSLLIAPIVAAAGGKVPMMSGKGLGHTGGTSDKLESIPGYSLILKEKKIKENLKKYGLFIVGQSDNIAPADKKLYALRDVTATVESIDLISASIMSKKLAEGMDALVLDVKTGNGAFMQSRKDSIDLAKSMVDIGFKLKKKMFAFITDMNQPLGYAIGNSLEIIQTIEILKNKPAPQDLLQLSLILSGQMLVLCNKVKNLKQGIDLSRKMIENGQALEKLRQMIKAQKGDPKVIDDYSLLPKANKKIKFKSPVSGYISNINTMLLGQSSVVLGAGREKLGSKIDYGVGYILEKKLGDHVEKNDTLLTILYNNDLKLKEARKILKKVYEISKKHFVIPPLVYGIVTEKGFQKKTIKRPVKLKPNELISKLLNKKKIEDGFKKFLENSKQEGREYKEMAQILGQFAVTGHVSKEDAKKVYMQLLDTVKLTGSASLWMIPGGSVLLIVLVKLAEKWDINLLPTAFKKENVNEK